MNRQELSGRAKVYAISKAKGDKGGLESVKVVWRSAKYGSNIVCYPEAYKLSFNPDGAVRHTACLIDCEANALYEVPLDEVSAMDEVSAT